MNKTRWLHAAELFDSWRIVPRIFLGATTSVICWNLTSLVVWYERTPAAWNGAVTAGLTVLTGALAALQGFVFKVYADNGRNWAEHPVGDQA